MMLPYMVRAAANTFARALGYQVADVTTNAAPGGYWTLELSNAGDDGEARETFDLGRNARETLHVLGAMTAAARATARQLRSGATS
jgi:hypothetical protein